MSRMIRYIMACAVIVVLVSVATAQQKPEPVIRLGDWVEIGNEAFMNIIASGDMRYNTSHNMDFEDRIRDRANNRDPFDTSNHDQEGDHFYVEARLGADFRYQKSLRFQILFEWQGTLDGNLIDDRHNDENPGGTDIFGRGPVSEDESVNLERIWLQYTFPGTPLRIHLGPDLWYSDQAGMVADDDPRFGFYLDLPNDLEIGAWAVLQTSAHRLGLQNDNDFWYYVFHASFKGAKPHVLALDIAYFRERANGAPNCLNEGCAPGPGGQVLGNRVGEEHDSVIIMPSWSGAFGPLTALLQPMIVFGSAEGAGVAGSPDFDIFAWGGVAYLEADLGIVRPFLGLVIGSADDDGGDDDLNGFMTLPQGEITLITGTSFFEHLDTSVAMGSRDIVTPARANTVPGLFGAGGTQEFSHTVGNPLNNRIGNVVHPGINSAYSNPGTLLIPAGVRFAPVRGHDMTLAYLYRAMLDSEIVEAALGVKVKEHLYHEVMLVWEWTLNRHFDIRLHGSVLIPGEGAKDIAETSTATATGQAAFGGGCPCEGEDIGFHGQARFRARF